MELPDSCGAAPPPSWVEAARPSNSLVALRSSHTTRSPEIEGCSWVCGEVETASPASSVVVGQPVQIFDASKTSRAVRSTTGSSCESMITCSTPARASMNPLVGVSRVARAPYTARSKEWTSSELLPGCPSIWASRLRMLHSALFQIAEL